jgi:hypothetical protein
MQKNSQKVIDMYVHVGDKKSEIAALNQLTESQQTVVNYIIGFLSSKTPESRFSSGFEMSLTKNGTFLQVSVFHLSKRDDQLLVIALEEGLPDYSFEFYGLKSVIKFAFNDPCSDE